MTITKTVLWLLRLKERTRQMVMQVTNRASFWPFPKLARQHQPQLRTGTIKRLTRKRISEESYIGQTILVLSWTRKWFILPTICSRSEALLLSGVCDCGFWTKVLAAADFTMAVHRPLRFTTRAQKRVLVLNFLR